MLERQGQTFPHNANCIHRVHDNLSWTIKNIAFYILNHVCPAEFDTGAALNMMILSVPEGHDKPLKYPLVFQVCNAMIINKIDVMPYFDFDMEKVTEYARMRNPNIRIFPISAKTGEGVQALADWLTEQAQNWKQK